jgi:hypothetical protein
MSDTYEINESNQVVPYTSGRKCTDTRAWRDATDLELQQQEQIEQLERELTEARQQRDTLVDAAQAVVDRWDAPTWKELEPTAKMIGALRKAIAAVKGGSDD